ncbi:MAG: methylisocitrate lyase [Candidatus Kapabacteria bacterium]|nr:methylisocitrate lyase [Candidatus Kapabacteria bacterium]MCS7169738.1 methylisocitrate lyase [Candidatus Kapabacteria bacterium]MDW7997487.1 methylisocitrate lyase [Bacteroidota bacterium]MDW8224971.1 methylisocitrate lyase [Bacteroidota bacterium]
MAWLLTEVLPQVQLAERFRQRVQQGRLLIPGAHDPLAGLLARAAGFEALYLSGAALSASMGMPDLGLLTLDEIVGRAQALVRATGLPLLVDADTGFGEVLNVVRLGRHLVEAGVVAVQLEDQEMPKRCGHLSGKRLVPPEVMARKVRALKHLFPTLVIVARTDAHAIEGMEGVLRRAQIYVDAGADIIFPEALQSLEEFRMVRKALPVPLLANLTEFGKTPSLGAEDVFAIGYEIALFPVSSLRVAAKAMQEFYSHLYQHGSSREYLSRMQTRAELYGLIEYSVYEDFDNRLAKA